MVALSHYCCRTTLQCQVITSELNSENSKMHLVVFEKFNFSLGIVFMPHHGTYKQRKENV